MPYEGEFAGYRPLRRIVETERVRQLLSRARVIEEPAVGAGVIPTPAPSVPTELPDFAVAIDGSTHEAPVRIGYPGAAVGYFTVASVLLNLKEMDRLDAMRPVDPQLFRKTEEAATIDAALPGANVVIRTHTSARDSFREALFEVFQDIVVDEEDHKPLAETYEALLALKPTSRPPACPYQNGGCTQYFTPPPGLTTCPCAERRPVYCTDALRIHERFQDGGSNGEAFGEVRQVWELVLMIHLLRCFERKGWLEKMDRLVFLLDGPLAVFGHPAWISAAISRELKRLNKAFRKASGKDLLVLGIEKTGTFSDHFEQLDRTDTGEPRFGPRNYILTTDQYINESEIISV